MPYPFRQWPTIQEFSNELSDRGVSLEKRGYTHVNLEGSDHKEHLVLLREVDGRVLMVPVDPALENERLMPDVFRSLCRALRIDVKTVEGFNLG